MKHWQEVTETNMIESEKVQFREESFCNKWPDVEGTPCWKRFWLVKDKPTRYLNGLVGCCPRLCFVDQIFNVILVNNCKEGQGTTKQPVRAYTYSSHYRKTLPAEP